MGGMLALVAAAALEIVLLTTDVLMAAMGGGGGRDGGSDGAGVWSHPDRDHLLMLSHHIRHVMVLRHGQRRDVHQCLRNLRFVLLRRLLDPFLRVQPLIPLLILRLREVER